MRMKSGIGTLITGVVLLLGAFVIPLLLVLHLVLGGSNAVQFKIPGAIEAAVKEPGRYYLWNDFQTMYAGKNYNRPEGIPDGIEIAIHDSNGELLTFVGDASISSSAGGTSKKSIGYVEVQSPGKVRIEVAGGNEERVFSFSQFGLMKMFRFILGGFGLSVLVGVAGLGVTIWGIVKLVRANKKGPGPA
jgi:hypothetical protein